MKTKNRWGGWLILGLVAVVFMILPDPTDVFDAGTPLIEFVVVLISAVGFARSFE